MNNMSKGSILAIIVVLTIIMTGLIVNKHCKAQDKSGYDYGLWLSLSKGSSINEPSYSIEGRFGDWGGGIVRFLDVEQPLCSETADLNSSCVKDYSIPTFLNHKITSENKKTENTTGIIIKRFFSIPYAQSLHIGGGFYSIHACKIAQSELTGWNYCQQQKNVSKLGASIGYTKQFNHLLTGVQYSTFRGFSLLAGFAW